MKIQDLIDNAGSIIENGVENRAQFDEAMSLYGELVCQAAKAAAALKLLGELVKGLGALTAEYAIGTIAAAAFGAVLYTVVTGDSIVSALTGIVERALQTSV